MYAELRQKNCSKCKILKSEKEFYKVAGGKRPRPECKSCTAAYTRKYRATEHGAAVHKRCREKYLSQPDNVLRDAQNKAEWARFKKYGIVKSQFLQLAADQDGKCAICQTPEDLLEKGFVVDHDHKTGAVRGLLCHHCNSGIGMLRDNISTLQSAIQYLSKSKKS